MRESRCTERAAGGFTLVELALVVLIIAIILAIAMPRMIPAIAYSELEGAARHLAGYGRSLMAHCALSGDAVTFKVDMGQRDYWSVRWILADAAFLDENEEDEAASPSAVRAPVPGSEEDTAMRAQDLEEQFQRFAYMKTRSRARNVPKDDFLDEIGPLFEEEFTLEEEEDEESTEELKTDLLSRTWLPGDVQFESIRVGTREYTTGTVEIDVTSLGLAEAVVFTIVSGDEYYTVAWDAVTGGAHIKQGKEDTE